MSYIWKWVSVIWYKYCNTHWPYITITIYYNHNNSSWRWNQPGCEDLIATIIILIFTTLDCTEAGGRQLLRSLQQISKTDGLFLQLFLIHPSSFWQSIYHPPQNAADITVSAFAGIHMHEAYICRSSDGDLLKSQGITCYVWPLLTMTVLNECCLMRTFPGCIGYLREKTFWTFPTPSPPSTLESTQCGAETTRTFFWSPSNKKTNSISKMKKQRALRHRTQSTRFHRCFRNPDLYAEIHRYSHIH